MTGIGTPLIEKGRDDVGYGLGYQREEVVVSNDAFEELQRRRRMRPRAHGRAREPQHALAERGQRVLRVVEPELGRLLGAGEFGLRNDDERALSGAAA